MGRLINADVLREEVCSWGMNDYEPSDFTDVIDNTPIVLTIPDNPTNGDVCRAIFETMTCNCILSTMGINWWNSPYKGGSTNVSNNL